MMVNCHMFLLVHEQGTVAGGLAKSWMSCLTIKFDLCMIGRTIKFL